MFLNMHNQNIMLGTIYLFAMGKKFKLDIL